MFAKKRVKERRNILRKTNRETDKRTDLVIEERKGR